MIIEKNEIATKLRKLKGILTGGRMQESAGILVKGNSLYASNIEIGMKAVLSIENSDEEFVIPKKAIELIVLGFTERFKRELPMEYAVELNALLKNNL